MSRAFSKTTIDYYRRCFREEIRYAIVATMEQQGVDRARLGELLGVNEARVNVILSGVDLDMDTVADVFLVLGRSVHIVLGRIYPVDDVRVS